MLLPNDGERSVFVIGEAQFMNVQAQNALLKILEEPPEHLMFILATTELHKVPATILSRCQRYAFRRISPADIAARLRYVAGRERIPLTDDGAELLARLAEGALRDGLSLLDQCAASGGTVDSAAVLNTLGLAGHLQTAALLEHILRKDVPSALSLFGELYDNGRDGVTVLRELAALVRDLLLKRMAPEGSAALLSGGYDDNTLNHLESLSTDARLLYLATSLQGIGAEFADAKNSRLNTELCLLRLCDETLSGDMSALVARVERLEAGYSAAPAQVAPVTRPAAPPPVTLPNARPVSPPPPPQNEAPPPDDMPPWDDVPPPDNAPPWDNVPPPENVSPWDSIPQADNAPPVPKPDAAPALDWNGLSERCRARLPMMYRPFLSQCCGTLSDGLLTLYAPDSVTLGRLNNERVTAVLLEESGAERVAMREGSPPPVSPQENREALLTFSRQRPDVIHIIGD